MLDNFFFISGTDYAGDKAVGLFEQTLSKTHFPDTKVFQASGCYEQYKTGNVGIT